MKMKKLLAIAGVSLSLAAGAVFVPSAANAAPVSTNGLNTCKVWYTYEQKNRGGSCYLMPGNTACWYTVKVKHTSCTQY